MVTMYTRLLGAALDEHRDVDTVPTKGEALAELLRRRDRLRAVGSSRKDSDWAASAVADELAYDVALIGLARCLAIDCDLRGFERALHERRVIEQALEFRGIRLDALDEQDPPVRSS